MNDDRYRVPARHATAETRVRASRFLAFAGPATDAADAEAEVEARRREFHDATHVVFAYRLRGAGGAPRIRAADAGEPAGTAGRPILAALEAADLVDALVVVARWFGGTKLGTGGLARAYRDVAARALAAAGAEERFDYVRLAVECPYDRVTAVKRLLAPPEIVLVGETFDARARFVMDVRRARVAEVRARLADARLECREA